VGGGGVVNRRGVGVGTMYVNIFPTSKKKEETKQRKNKTEQKERAALT